MGFAPGDRVGEYRIVAPLQHGGTSRLYVAEPAEPGRRRRRAALKVVHLGIADDPQFAHMLSDEAGILARLAHPNVVQMVELGRCEGAVYLALEYVHGCTLSKLLRSIVRRNQRLRVELAVHLAREIAAGLHAAHELVGDDGVSLDLVHRDVSPQNTLLGRDGQVKVIDFGVARARDRVQSTGTLLKGKVQYMAPEQIDNSALDRRADVYALGVMLWEMLTGRALFAGGTVLEVYHRILEAAVRPPSDFAPDVPPALDAVVLAAVSPDRSRRPVSAAALRSELAYAVPGARAIDRDEVGKLVCAVLDGAAEDTLLSPLCPERNDVIEIEIDVAFTDDTRIAS